VHFKNALNSVNKCGKQRVKPGGGGKTRTAQKWHLQHVWGVPKLCIERCLENGKRLMDTAMSLKNVKFQLISYKGSEKRRIGIDKDF